MQRQNLGATHGTARYGSVRRDIRYFTLQTRLFTHIRQFGVKMNVTKILNLVHK